VPYQNWLLVFDNAETPDEVQRFFPTGGAGKILVTSRYLDWSRVTQSIEVDVFTREESTTFLRNRNPELTGVDADRLAEALGDLPLAVEQAAAWRAATGMPVDEYLELLEDKRIELLDASPSPDYKRSVAAALEAVAGQAEADQRGGPAAAAGLLVLRAGADLARPVRRVTGRADHQRAGRDVERPDQAQPGDP
jgi:hypothetical protein